MILDEVITRYENPLSMNRIRKKPPKVIKIDIKASIIKINFHLPLTIEFFSNIRAVKKNINEKDTIWLWAWDTSSRKLFGEFSRTSISGSKSSGILSPAYRVSVPSIVIDVVRYMYTIPILTPILSTIRKEIYKALRFLFNW